MDKRGQRKTIGLVIDWIASWGEMEYYQTKILKGLDGFCREHDYNLLVFVVGRFDSPNPWEKNRNALFDFVSNRLVDGVVVLSSIGIFSNQARFAQLVRSLQPLPIVTLGNRIEGLPLVSVDNQGAMNAIVDHLIEVHGKRRIAFIKGIEGNSDAETRLDAYRDSLARHGLPFSEELVLAGNFFFEAGIEAIRHLCEDDVDFDAIAAANDNMAIGALVEIHRRGQPPLSITGFDDADGSKFHSLTTVNQSFYDQGYVAGSAVAELIEGRPIPETTLVRLKIVMRSSCGCESAFVPSIFRAKAGVNGGLSLREIIEELARDIENPVLRNDFRLQIGNVAQSLAENRTGALRERLYGVWDNFLRWAMREKIGILTISTLIAHFRTWALQETANAAEAVEIDSFFLAAETQLCERIETPAASVQYGSDIVAGAIDEFAETLFSEFDIAKQMDIVFRSLPGFGIGEGLVARFLDPSRPLDGANALLAFAGGQRFEPNGSVPPAGLFPPRYEASLRERRHSIIVQALHCGDTQIGYLAAGIGESVGRRLELVRNRLAIALKGAIAVEELEGKVRERTSELTGANERLARSLASNDVLMKELQHRVKNNLNVVASLLNLGADSLEHPEAKKVLMDARMRIESMSAIYEQLYRKSDFTAEIDLSSYLEGLARSLFETYAVDKDGIRLALDIVTCRIDMKRAISLGLLVNELVSNALKHAWRDRPTGILRIALGLHDGVFVLSVADDGGGISDRAIEGRSGSLGLSLVRALAQDLGAELSIANHRGTRIELRVPFRAG